LAVYFWLRQYTGLTVGGIVGIVIGVVVALCFAAAAAYFYKQHQAAQQDFKVQPIFYVSNVSQPVVVGDYQASASVKRKLGMTEMVAAHGIEGMESGIRTTPMLQSPITSDDQHEVRAPVQTFVSAPDLIPAPVEDTLDLQPAYQSALAAEPVAKAPLLASSLVG